MIPFIVPERGKDTVGLIKYLFGPGRFNEHIDQRVIAGSDHLGIEGGLRLDHRMDKEQIRELGRELDAHRKALGVEVPKGHVWHCAISLPPEDSTDARKLNDEQWAEVARSAVRTLGFEGGTQAPCRWLAVHHGKSINGNEHIHLAVNLVREDGRIAGTWNDRRKLQSLCKEFERRFGLRIVEGRGSTFEPGLSRAEIERAARSPGRPEPERRTLTRIVRGAAIAAADEADFVSRVRNLGAQIKPRFEADGEAVIGYSVALRQGTGQSLWFGGGRLDGELTLPRLRERWDDEPTARQNALAAWRSSEQQAEPQGAYGPDTWQAATKVLAEVGTRLRHVPIDDHAAWAGVSREVAGILAIWSARIEGRRPGPMASISEALAAAARTRHDEPRAYLPREAIDLRGVAMVVFAASPRGRGERGQLLLLRQLLCLLEVLDEVQRAQGRAFNATARAATARNQLLQLQAGELSAAFSSQSQTPAQSSPTPEIE